MFIGNLVISAKLKMYIGHRKKKKLWRSINAQKKNGANIKPSRPSNLALFDKIFILWLRRNLGQTTLSRVSVILPAQVANHNSGIG